MTDTILRFEDVHKAFFGVPVLEGITLDVERGSIVGLVGENGAGKSTLMNILGGVVPAGRGPDAAGRRRPTRRATRATPTVPASPSSTRS